MAESDKRHTNASVLDYYAYVAESGERSPSSSPSSSYSAEFGESNDNRQASVLERIDSNSFTHLNVYRPDAAEGQVKVGSYDYNPDMSEFMATGVQDDDLQHDQGTSIGTIPSDVLLKRRKSDLSVMSIKAHDDQSDSSTSSQSTVDLPATGEDAMTVTRDMPFPNAFFSKSVLDGAISPSDRAMRMAEAINALANAASGMQIWLRCVGGENRTRGYSPPPLIKHSERYRREKTTSQQLNYRSSIPSIGKSNSIHSTNAQGSSSPYMTTPVVPYAQERHHSSASFSTNSTFPLRGGSDVNVAHDLTSRTAAMGITDSPPDKIPEELPYPGAASLKKVSSTNSSVMTPKSGKASRAAGFFANLGRRTSAKSPPKKLQIGNPSPITKTVDLPNSKSSISPPLFSPASSSPPTSPSEPPTAPPGTTSFRDKEVTVPARHSSHKKGRHLPSASTSHINLEGLDRTPTGPRAKPGSKTRNSSIFNLDHVLNPEPFPGLANLKPPSKYGLRASTPAPVRKSSRKNMQQASNSSVPSEDLSPAFKASLSRLENLLPQASKSELKSHLKKANGDEMRAVGTYIESQR
ncbi:hypothetical protein E3Q11_03714 [Wallemia mellicola]|nr:hypothetical protein E3Q11_03714 [Wallemia mellicola]TIC73098.1 hypothetical protein E3Q00_03279 [Wallemia mellicola]